MSDMGTAAMTDAELVEASRRGEHAAFGHLVERYQGVVCAVSYSSTGDRVLSEDVAQETFIAAWRQLDQLRETVRLRSWLCGIARNLGRKARRRTGRETLVDQPAAAIADGTSPFEATSAAQAEQVVRDALDRVPETYREVLVLYYREGRSAKEVAAALGISEPAVLQRLARGRQHLADGVTDLVERALAPRAPTRDLRAGVLAVIPAIPASRVDPLATSTAHGGSTMIKIALVAAATVAAGTTAYVVHSRTDTAAPPAAAAAAVVAPAPARAALPTPAPAPAAAAAPTAGTLAGGPRLEAGAPQAPNTVMMPDDAEIPVVSAEILARTKLDQGPDRGPPDAPVTVILFTDLKCTYCGKVLGVLDQLWDEYDGKLRLVMKQFPVHDSAVLAAEAALAADAQGKFWELHDLMMANQDDVLDRDTILALAKQAGLDAAALRTALDHHTFKPQLDADRAAATEIEIRATPTFLINGKRFTGAQPIEQFRAAIDEALAAVGKAP
jgi:RNA polymerase sigma factor (sigma-70 family)